MMKRHCDCCDKFIPLERRGAVRSVTIGNGYNIDVYVRAQKQNESLDLCDECVNAAAAAFTQSDRPLKVDA